jgi:hypothetical protein
MAKRFIRSFAALALFCVGRATEVSAQSPDTTFRYSIFAGAVLSGNDAYHADGLKDAELGGSLSFRLPGSSLAWRANLSFRQQRYGVAEGFSPMRFGTVSLDGIGRPFRSVFGTHPYLLGGLGIGTRSEYTSAFTRYVPAPSGDSLVSTRSLFSFGRNTWAFAEGGLGFDLGRHMFVEGKLMVPVASNGPTFMPVSVGFRF